MQHMEVPRARGWKGAIAAAYAAAWQHYIQVASVTYSAACGNRGSLTCAARPGIKPASSPNPNPNPSPNPNPEPAETQWEFL